MIYINNLDYPKECILFIALYMELLCFFSLCFGHSGLHPNKSYASSPDIELGYSVRCVDIGQ